MGSSETKCHQWCRMPALSMGGLLVSFAVLETIQSQQLLAEDTVLSVTVILLLKSQQRVDAQKSEISMKRAVDNGCASTSGLNSAEQPSFEHVALSSCCYMPWVVISACIYVGKGYGFSWGLLFSCYELVQRGPVLGSALYFCL